MYLDKNWPTPIDKLSKYKIVDIFNLIMKDDSSEMKNKELKNIITDELPYLQQFIHTSNSKRTKFTKEDYFDPSIFFYPILEDLIIGDEKDIRTAVLKDELKFWTQRVKNDDKVFWEIRDRLKKRIEELEK